MTLKRAIEIIETYTKLPAAAETTAALDRPDGAAKLAKILIERCTHLKLFIGKSVNPAHQNPDFPTELRVKSRLMDDLGNAMARLGRAVDKKYY